MERLLFHIYEELRKSFEVALVGPNGCGDHVKRDTRVLACPPMPPWKFLIHCQVQTLLMAKRFAPDLILSGSGVTAPAAVMAGRLLGIPVLTYLHGLDVVADSHIYRSIFLPAVRRAERIVVNSRNTARLARAVKIISPVDILHPGVTIPPISALDGGKSLRERINATTIPILLSVGRLTPRKGIPEFIEHCLPRIVEAYPDVLYLIIGSEPKNAIGGQGGMKGRILEIAEKRGLMENILLMKDVNDETLSQAYAASQLHVFPVIDQPNDVEGFGMVAVEAAAHGLPTVAFATGGVVEAVSDGVSGYLMRPGDYEGLAGAILAHLRHQDSKVFEKSCREYAQAFAWSMFGDRLRSICAKTMG